MTTDLRRETTRSALSEPRAPSSEPTEQPAAFQLLREIASDLVRYRELLYELTVRDLRIRYKQSVMGVLWAILTPLVVVLAGAIVKIAFASMVGRSVAPVELAGLAIKST